MRLGRETLNGSPPRAWGRPLGGRHAPLALRFTPTRVGTAPCPSTCDLVLAVHPHARGDGRKRTRTLSEATGSPPRAWGRRCSSQTSIMLLRFTPTRVGTAWPLCEGPDVVSVHPHARGDGASGLIALSSMDGSPPRAWGRPRPAWRACGPPSVHPHARGDGGDLDVGTPDHAGSPPRAWGRRQLAPPSPSPSRFTPTRVGTAHLLRRSSLACAVHPHARGDGDPFAGYVGSSSGSPPRAWGRRTDERERLARLRFTPTRVGTAVAWTPWARVFSVHPHARGDGRTGLAARQDVHGSPPRAWGRRLRRPRGAWEARFTPTRVGTARCLGRTRLRHPVHPHARGDGDCVSERDAEPLRFTPTRVGTATRRYRKARCTPVHPHARGDGGFRFFHRALAPGSPPRAWGRLALGLLGGLVVRFTPTRVGTAQEDCLHADSASGSPPRAWGRPRGSVARRRCPRFTPTRVGTAQDHAAGSVRDLGSPPRAWGRRSVVHGEVGGRRFPPTRVGTAPPPSSSTTRPTVHPHARGDGLDPAYQRDYDTGSPPRAWGRHGDGDRGELRHRFTPTRVGTACATSPLVSSASVHPHARGDGTGKDRF